jgi:regulator of protease activity HflC (stomatin/prohibitin superfamily)
VTRDGIPVETSVSVTFQVRRPSADRRRPRSIEADVIPYPYDRDALFDLTYIASVGDEEKRGWTDQVAPQAATLLVTEIGKYTLDDLLVSGGAEPMADIRERIKAALKDQQGDEHLQSLTKGIDILGVGVGGLELPPEVLAKRLSTWQVEWRNRIDQELVSGNIEAQRAYQQARARAQIENIENLLMSIEDMRRQSGVELHKIIMLRLMEIVEAISATRTLGRPTARAALTSMTSEATTELRQALGMDEETPAP